MPDSCVFAVAVACSAVLVVLMLQTASPAAGGGATPQAQQQPEPAAQSQSQPQQQQATDPASNPSTIADLFSIDHIRKQLERKPALTFTTLDPKRPTYHVTIEGYRFEMPSWKDNFLLPQMPVQQPLGGADFYEMRRLNTAPQAWGSAPFSNGDLLKMYGLTGAYGLAGALIKKGLEARENAASARAREEVQQEMADVAAHNARVAAGQADDSGADAKKAAEKKKQEAKKKKKKDGGK